MTSLPRLIRLVTAASVVTVARVEQKTASLTAAAVVSVSKRYQHPATVAAASAVTILRVLTVTRNLAAASLVSTVRLPRKIVSIIAGWVTSTDYESFAQVSPIITPRTNATNTPTRTSLSEDVDATSITDTTTETSVLGESGRTVV